jgi:hypothetical protein
MNSFKSWKQRTPGKPARIESTSNAPGSPHPPGAIDLVFRCLFRRLLPARLHAMSRLEELAREPLRPPRKLEAWIRDPRAQAGLALALWILPMLVITIMVASRPWHRTVTPTYHRAVENWWAHKDLYADFDYHYLPQFVPLFAPFHLLPPQIGETLWRWVAAALLAWGLWRLLRSLAGSQAPKRFLQATLICLPLCLPALRNGQANALLAGLFLLSIAFLTEKKWWEAALCMVLSLAVKQFSVVLLGLAVLVYAPLRWRIAAGLLALAALPFLFGPPDYVIAQHRAAFAHLQVCATVTEHRFADLNGIFRTLGWQLPPAVSSWVRAGAGGLMLLVWWLGARRLPEWPRAAWLYALAASYLMLFNPMTEANSYVILAPALATWAAWALGQPATRNAGWILAGMGLAAGVLPGLLHPFFGNHFALFWYPLTTLVFLAILTSLIWQIRRPAQIS